jgi:hypothetical protein
MFEKYFWYIFVDIKVYENLTSPAPLILIPKGGTEFATREWGFQSLSPFRERFVKRFFSILCDFSNILLE